jgi:hypothetical protein
MMIVPSSKGDRRQILLDGFDVSPEELKKKVFRVAGKVWADLLVLYSTLFVH